MVQAKVERQVEHLRSRWRRTREEAHVVLDAWAGGGEPVIAFARKMKLVAQRLFWWRRRLELHGSRPPVTRGATPAFVPVVVRHQPDSGGAKPVAVLIRGDLRSAR